MTQQRCAAVAPVRGTVIAIEVVVGQAVRAGQPLVLLESMKMEFPLEAAGPGTVRAIVAAVGDVVDEGAVLVEVEPGHADAAMPPPAPAPDPALPRADLRALLERRSLLEDAARPEAVRRRHAVGAPPPPPKRAPPAGPGTLGE